MLNIINRTYLSFLKVTALPCGEGGKDQMVNDCTLCPKENGTISKSWCDGYCILDEESGNCTERCKIMFR